MRAILLIAIALSFMAGAACAPAAPSAPAAPAAPQSAPPPAAPAASGPAASAPAATPPPRVSLRFGLNTTGANVTPVWVTKEEGFFDKYGIDAEVLPLPGADRIVAAVVSGEVPITALSATALVNAVLAGADMVFVGSYDNRLRFWLYARPEITSVQELRGKQLAISSRGGIIRRATELALERNGLDPERDATLLVTGNVTNSLTALLTGNVAAAMFGPPETFRAADEGMRQLVDTTDYNFPMIIQGIAASRAWIAQNQDLTRRVLQAIGEGLAFTHQHKERTKEIIGKYTQSDDALLLERTYNTRVPGFERVPYAPADAIRSDLDMLAEENPAARDARPGQFVDNRFVEELDRAGFFQRLYP